MTVPPTTTKPRVVSPSTTVAPHAPAAPAPVLQVPTPPDGEPQTAGVHGLGAHAEGPQGSFSGARDGSGRPTAAASATDPSDPTNDADDVHTPGAATDAAADASRDGDPGDDDATEVAGLGEEIAGGAASASSNGTVWYRWWWVPLAIMVAAALWFVLRRERSESR